MRIPMKPASAESTAPPMYATAPHGQPQGRKMTISAVSAATKNAMARYSRRRNAIAPVLMTFINPTMVSLPGSAASTCLE